MLLLGMSDFKSHGRDAVLALMARDMRCCSSPEGTLLTNLNSLEERRKAKGAAYHERKKLAQRQLTEAKKSAQVDSKTTKALESFGY